MTHTKTIRNRNLIVQTESVANLKNEQKTKISQTNNDKLTTWRYKRSWEEQKPKNQHWRDGEKVYEIIGVHWVFFVCCDSSRLSVRQKSVGFILAHWPLKMNDEWSVHIQRQIKQHTERKKGKPQIHHNQRNLL